MDEVKDMLAELNVQDTDYASAGDMFELGAKVQVMEKGVFFPARANKLYELWRSYDSHVDEIVGKLMKVTAQLLNDDRSVHDKKICHARAGGQLFSIWHGSKMR